MSRTISMASGAILHSVYREAAAPSLPGEPKFPWPGDQRVAQRPRLDQADHGVVDRGVAVGVVLTHDVADDAAALGEGAVGAVAAIEHRVQHAAVDGLEAVAHIGKRAADDDRHGVVHVGPLHLGVEVDVLDAAVVDDFGAVRCQGNAHPSHCAE